MSCFSRFENICSSSRFDNSVTESLIKYAKAILYPLYWARLLCALLLDQIYRARVHFD